MFFPVDNGWRLFFSLECLDTVANVKIVLSFVALSI